MSPRVAGRAAQLLLGIPLGLFQLAAVVGFALITKPMARADWLVVAWGVPMATASALVALRVYDSARARQIAFALLAAQALFSLVKLIVFHESASLVFLAIIAVTGAALALYHRAPDAGVLAARPQ